MNNRHTEKLTVVFDGLTEAQKQALETMFHEYKYLCSVGSSRYVSFMVDGDGNFRPKITVNGEEPKFSEHLTREEIWHGDECRIDFDTIAWRLHDDQVDFSSKRGYNE